MSKTTELFLSNSKLSEKHSSKLHGMCYYELGDVNENKGISKSDR